MITPSSQYAIGVPSKQSAMAVATKDVRPFHVNVGIPAKSVRVKMKDHSFFIPLNSAGATAKAEGVFTVKTLSKEEVTHMIEEDGAKFEKVNADGTVTEISFEAAGVELTRKK